MPVWIGTSGWQYDHWRSTFYPEGLAKSRWLDWYASRFATVESNSAFYRLPEEKLFEKWADQTPSDFVMAVKASRYLTHILRLRDPEAPVKRLLQRVRGLAHKLGPILLQLPPNLVASTALLDATLRSFSESHRVAFEARHESWFTNDVRSVLESHGAALCLTDRRNRRSPIWRTTNWTYVRLHEGTASPSPSYGRRALDGWADRIASQWDPEEDVFCYFNNDENGRAPVDAHRFALSLKRHGLNPTRSGAAGSHVVEHPDVGFPVLAHPIGHREGGETAGKHIGAVGAELHSGPTLPVGDRPLDLHRPRF